MNEEQPEPAEFDRFADNYDQLHAQSLGASGEGPEYFAEYKARCLERFGVAPGSQILDYGCGVGNLTKHLALRSARVFGYDPSSASIDRARVQVPGATFCTDPEALPHDAFDAIVLANILHHVPPSERSQLVARLVPLLVPGGRLFVFEHNPYNPLARRSVALCAFDIDVILLSPGEVRRLLRDASLVERRQAYIVFFPRLLAALRFLEPALGWLPAGAQTLTLGARPGRGES